MPSPRYSIRTLRAPIEGEVRTLCNKEYVVIPVVALIEGVRHAGGSPAPELVLAESFGRHVETWNGRPVVVNHPVNAEGAAVLASSPDILEGSYLGTLMGAKIEDKRLLTEVWLDVVAIEASSSEGVQGMWKRLVAGEIVEVSVGAIVYTKRGEGEFEGKRYVGSWDIVIPDHLAFLDGDQIGACSVEDGCGTFRTHVSGQVRLSKGARDKMAKMGTLKTVGVGTASTTTASNGGEPREACGCGDKKGLVAGHPEEAQVETGRVFARMLWSADTFDHDRRSLMQRALTDKFGASKGTYVVTFNDSQVVFEQFNGDKFTLFSMDYESDASNNVTLSGDAVEVMLQTKTVPAPTSGKDTTMASKALQALADKSKKKKEDDEMEDKDEEGDEGIPAKGKKKNASSSIPTHILSLAEALDAAETLEDIAKALDGTTPGKRLRSAMKVCDSARAQCVKVIQASSGGKSFDTDTLSELPFEALSKMAVAFLAADKKAAADAEARALEDEGSEFEEGAEGEEEEVEEEEEEEELDADGNVAGLSAIMDLDGAADRANAPPPAKKSPPVARKSGQARLSAPGRAQYGGRAARGSAGNGGVPPAPDVFAFDNNGEYVGPKGVKANA